MPGAVPDSSVLEHEGTLNRCKTEDSLKYRAKNCAHSHETESHLMSLSLAVREGIKLDILMSSIGGNIEDMRISKNAFKTQFSSSGSI